MWTQYKQASERGNNLPNNTRTTSGRANTGSVAFGPPAITHPPSLRGDGQCRPLLQGWGWVGGTAVPTVPFLQNTSVKRGSPLCVMSLKLNSFFGFVSPSLGFCDLRCMKHFSVFRKNTEEYVVLWVVRKPLEDALEDAVEDGRPLQVRVVLSSSGRWAMAPSYLNKQVMEDAGLFVTFYCGLFFTCLRCTRVLPEISPWIPTK